MQLPTSNLMCRVLGLASQAPATRSPSGDTLCRHIFPLIDLQVVIFSRRQIYRGQIADAPCLYFDVEQAVSRSATKVDRHPRGEKVEKFRFSPRLDDWGINTSRKRCQGKRITFAKLKYFWSNSFSDYNNILFSIEISSALFKRLVKSDQWIQCLKPEFAIFWERQSPCRLITSTRVSSWVFIRQCQQIMPFIIFFNFFSKTFLSPTSYYLKISKMGRL